MNEEKKLDEEVVETTLDEEAVATQGDASEAAANEAADASETPVDEATDKKDKKDKKKDKAKDEKDKLKSQVEELNDKVVRQMAEFDNFRKRTEKEKQTMFEAGAKSVVEKILPVVDNFERGINAISDEEREGNFAKGMIAIYKQLMDELEKMDVKPIEAVGLEFDPNLHNAVMQTQSDEFESGIVAQELQKGYTYRDQVVRHSMVAVVE